MSLKTKKKPRINWLGLIYSWKLGKQQISFLIHGLIIEPFFDGRFDNVCQDTTQAQK